MTSHLLSLAADILAAPSPDPTQGPTAVQVTGAGLLSFLFKVIAPILLAVLGIAVLARSRKGDMSATMNSTAVALVGITFLALASGMAFLGLGSFLVDLAVK